MSKKARSLVFLGPSDGEKVLLCFKWGVLNYALECRLDGVQNHSRSRPYPCTRAFGDGVGWPSPLLHGREDFWVIIVFCCWVGILCVCFQVDIVLQVSTRKLLVKFQPCIHELMYWLWVWSDTLQYICSTVSLILFTQVSIKISCANSLWEDWKCPCSSSPVRHVGSTEPYINWRQLMEVIQVD